MASKSDMEILDEATRVIVARGNERIEINVQLTTLLDLIAMVQVALRHPRIKNDQPAQRTEKFIRDLIERIDPEHGPVWRLLQMGFNPKHDV